MSKRYLTVLMSVLVTLATSAADKLLTGSIDFDTPSLWDTRVTCGADDKGGTTGKSYWYTDSEGADGGTIFQHPGTGTGYFSASTNSIHRTTSPTTSSGPISGESITERAVYTDVEVKMTAVDDAEGMTPGAQDRLLIWVYEGKLRISAGSLVGNNYYQVKRVYETDMDVDLNTTHRILTKAYVKRWSVDSDNYAVPGYEITFDGAAVKSIDGVEFFPSLIDSEVVYSVGFKGGAQAEYINFTRTDPAEDPTYYLTDVSMLRQAAELTADGYEGGRQTLYDFPLLVRISPAKIKGFNYAYAKSDGSDVRFTDESGKLLASEIDVWDSNGESLIWVKVPYFYSGVKIVMHWDLMPGGVAPINHSSEVWSDYLAVWHFKGNGSYRDATGNGYTAVFSDSAGIPNAASGGEVPFGYAAMSTNAAIVCNDIEKNYTLSNGFTFTGFYIGQSTTLNGQNAPALFGKRTAMASPNVKDAKGWTGSVAGQKTFAGFMDGQSYFSAEVSEETDFQRNWFYASYKYDGATATVSANDGSKRESKAGTITKADTNLVIAAAGAWVDEARITKKVRSTDWLYAEYAQWKRASFVTNGGSVTKETYNYWVQEPAITPSSWTREDAAAMDFSTVFFGGEPRYGIVVTNIYNEAGEELSYYPTNEVGVYRVVYSAEDGLHDPVSRELTYMIFEQQGYSYLPGQDRAMLFNSDVTPGCEVGLQSYYDVDSDDRSLWWHSSEDFSGAGEYVSRGAYHYYCKTNTYDSSKGHGEVLWNLRHCYIGNLFQSRKPADGDTIYHLPWTGYARRYDNSKRPADNQSYVGHAILQNLSLKSVDCADGDAAAIYTPYYKDGVGSLYFDAVNSHEGYVNALKVQIATNEVEDVTKPYLGEWVDVPLDVYTIVEGKLIASTSGVSEATLAMVNKGGSTNSFYRLRANVATTDNARLRIVRADSPDKGWSGDLDGLGLVSLDNIIVSPLSMGIKLEQYGAPADPHDTILRGWRAPFDVAFPSTNDIGKLHGAVRAKYMVAGTNTASASWIGAMTMKYRWRYLNQYVNDWQRVRMIPKGDDIETFVTEKPLEGVGVGDFEYSVNAVVNAPFYIFHDYGGLDLALGSGFSERSSDITLSAANEGLFLNELSPARGRDYFVRVRDGASDYEAVRVYVRKAGSKDYPGEELPLELCANHIWRGFRQTLKAVSEGLEYRVEFINYQDPAKSPAEYNWSTNYLYGVHTNTVPVNGTLVEGAADKWQAVECDALTGYLMFQVEDQSRSVTIIHADYQNFNRWSDAWSSVDDPYFTGTSELLPTSGVSQLTRNVVEDFEWLTPCSPSNANWWIEHFNETSTDDSTSKWCINKKFIGSKSTPNGWLANNGMWVSQRYSQLGVNSLSFQMMAGGFGSIAPSGLSARGMEKLDFTARLAQSYAINSFDPYVGTDDDVYNFTDYAFGVACAMKTSIDDDFNGAGAISLLAYYRETKGAYELRVERIGDNQVRMSLYKWTCNKSISGTEEKLGSFDSPNYLKYNELGFGGFADQSANFFARCYISCFNTPTSTWITAGIANQRVSVATEPTLTGANYYRVRYEDMADDRLTSGTVALGSKDCPAKFGRPQFFENPVAIDLGEAWTTTDGKIEGTVTGKSVSLGTPIQLLGSSADYDKWNIHVGRLEAKDYEHEIPYNTLGFSATITPQVLWVRKASRGSADYSVFTNVAVSSFGLQSHRVSFYSAEDIDIQVTTSTDGDTTDIVIDDLELTQWRGINIFPYGSNSQDDNPDRSKFPQTGYGSPSNIVYTTAWITDDNALEISPMRTTTSLPSGVRGPLFDGENGRGSGLGQISFTYRDADSRARLLVQIATNDVEAGNLADLTESVSDASWITVGDPIVFDSMSQDELASGTISRHIGLHGINGVMRVIVDTNLVVEAHGGCNLANDPTYGRIFITEVACKDNPDLGDGCWWGWNLRTTDDETKWLLKDGASDQDAYGKSFGLNNSIVKDVRDDQVYDTHMPFLQTPIFLDQGIGEVSFKARRYELGGPAPTVTIYGLVEGDSDAKDDKFERLGEVLITSDRFENYSFQANLSKRYHAFRFAVTGVDGIKGDGSGSQPATSRGPVPQSGYVERVLIDEVSVFEAITARLGFSNTGCFRTGLPETTVKDPFPIKSEQPLCSEAWGFQTELYAAQLSEKLVLDDPAKAPRVFVHWYQGKYPWGYDNWRDQAKAVTRELGRATDTTRMVYRSTYDSAFGNVVDPVDPDETRIFQYSMDVVYYMQDQDSPLTNTLSSTDWVKPSWYEPIDLNAQYGKGVFSAYNILDTVAPGWAWINEVNIYGGRDEDKINQDQNCQYVEIAAPQDADLTGWKVRFVKYESSDGSVCTNTLATLDGYKRKDAGGQYLNSASGMVFRVLASPATADAHNDWYDKGWLDGKWTFDDPDGNTFGLSPTYRVSEVNPFGIQLVRPTGIVEHEVVTIGTNKWASSIAYQDMYSPTCTVANLNKAMSGSHFLYIGDDNEPSTDASLSVTKGQGEISNYWNNAWVHTPGCINRDADGNPQELNEDAIPTPLGSSIYITAIVSGDHILQTCGTIIETNSQIRIAVQRGGKGTNFVYTLSSEWFVLDSVTTNNIAVPSASWRHIDNRRVEVAVGVGCSNNVTLVASAAPNAEALSNYGVTPGDPYTPAIISWLERGQDLEGDEWPTNDIKLARFWPYSDWHSHPDNTNATSQLSLKHMYWLDMCPRLTNDQYFVVGFCGTCLPISGPAPSVTNGYDEAHTNVLLSMFMVITNGLEHGGKTVYAPYVLQGMDFGYNSQAYIKPEATVGWTSVTFKVTGILRDKEIRTDLTNEDHWMPHRWFVFGEHSFKDDFTTDIEIRDPFGTDSPGYVYGWTQWVRDHGRRPDVWWKWSIDDRMMLWSPEEMKTNNYYKVRK